MALVGGALLVVGAMASGIEPVPTWEWRLGRWLEWLLLLVVYALLLLLVAAVLTSGGQGSAANVYSGAVFLSFLGAVGGLLARAARVRPADAGWVRCRSATACSAWSCCWRARCCCR